MARLLHDRYVVFDRTRGCDLVTGREVTTHALENTRSIPDSQSDRGAATQNTVIAEVLAHGRDGEPRWIVADARSAGQAGSIGRQAAADARRCGLVAMGADLYLRLCDVLREDLADRTLLLVGGFAPAFTAARAALVEASARTPRPHVLLTFRSRANVGQPCVAREAQAAYGVARRTTTTSAMPADVARLDANISRAEGFLVTGRHAAAERLLRETAAALGRRRHLAVAAAASIALGRLLVERGRPHDADAVLAEAARWASGAGDEDGAFSARIWQAAARCDAEQLTEAESVCRAALLAAPPSLALRIWGEAVLLRVLLWQGRIADEEASAPALREEERQELGASRAAFVDGVAVRVRLASGRVFDAGQRATTALECAGASPDPLARATAHTAALRVRTACGDLGAAAESFAEIGRAARDAHAPLRLARARLVWHDGLRHAGRSRDADTQLAFLARIRPVAPPLLRRAIERRLTEKDRRVPSVVHATPPAMTMLAATLIRLAHDPDDDEAAVRAVIERVAQELQPGRVDMFSADAGPVTTILTLGSGVATHLGSRVLDAGIVMGPETHDGGEEVGVPVRMGTRLLASIVARWPPDRRAAGHASDLLQLAALVIAPRVDAQLTGARVAAAASTSVPELVGTSRAMEDVRRAIIRAASAPFNVLIEGESGSGKELAARAVHQLSPRRERRFCDVNCAALPEELLDSELFGHARGAFTGAVADRAGLFEDAHGGTLFLDEVADLSPRGQAKLLRVVQQHEVRRLGETFSRKVDVRLVTAANRDMRAEAADGRFRQDLLYRLDVVRIRVPPLRDRPEDVAVLAEHFWRDAAARVGTTARLTHGVLTELTRYHWPGNVRELQNVVAALAVAAPSRGRVRPHLLPPVVTGATSVTALRLDEARTQFERRCVEVALARAGGSRSKAAAQLGLSRQGLLKMMVRLGMTTK